MNFEKISVFSKYLFFLCLVLILVFSALPGVSVESYEVADGFSFRLDYLLHFLAYSALTGFFLLWKKDNRVISILMGLIIGVLVAFMTEFQQQFIPGRTFNPVDAYFNVSGSFVGIVVMDFFRQKIIFNEHDS